MQLSTFLTVGLIGILAVMSPGPDFMITFRNGLRSRAAGLGTATGIAFGNLFWIAFSIGGVSLFIANVAWLYCLIKLLGAAYLIFIGAKSLFAKKKPQLLDTVHPDPTPDPSLSAWSGFQNGLLANLLNPKCGFFFAALFGTIIDPATPIYARCAYGLEILFIAWIWFSTLALLLSVGRFKQAFKTWLAPIERAMGAVLIALGLKVALSAK